MQGSTPLVFVCMRIRKCTASLVQSSSINQLSLTTRISYELGHAVAFSILSSLKYVATSTTAGVTF